MIATGPIFGMGALNTDGTITQAVAPDIMPEALSDIFYSNRGGGIVSIDGGSVTEHSCHAHHCADTVVYIVGPGSQAIIEKSDVLYNGKGNIQPGVVDHMALLEDTPASTWNKARPKY
jgi:hypothetical protein